MKKFLSTFFLASMMLSAYAGLGLTFVTVDENEEDIVTTITKDTTFIVTNYEEDCSKYRKRHTCHPVKTPAEVPLLHG